MKMWKYIKSNKFLSATALVAAVAAVCTWIQFGILGQRLTDPDAFYHARMAHLLGTGSVSQTFPWLPFTTWGSRFADQHFLYHVSLRLFPGLIGLQFSVLFWAAAVAAVFIYLLRKLDVRAIWLWSIFLLFGSADFLYRLNLVKATPVALVLLLLATILIIKRSWVWLAALAALFVLSYGGAVFLLPLVFGCVLVELFRSRRFEYRPLIALVAGLAVGIALHPQARELLPHLYDQFFKAGLGRQVGVPVGREWGGYSVSLFFSVNFFIFVPWAIALFVFFKKWRTPRQYSWWFVLLSVFFFVLTLRSRRFVDYWVPFATLFSAYELAPYLARIAWKNTYQMLRRHWQLWPAAIAVAGFLGFGAYNSLSVVGNYMRQSPVQWDIYKGAADWLMSHSNSGDIVLNTQWDQFPQLFYWDTKNYYVIGMDPTFMYLKDPTLYRQWRSVSDDVGGTWGEPAQFSTSLKASFGARYLFLEQARNPRLAGYLDAAAQQGSEIDLVYREGQVRIYELY